MKCVCFQHRVLELDDWSDCGAVAVIIEGIKLIVVRKGLLAAPKSVSRQHSHCLLLVFGLFAGFVVQAPLSSNQPVNSPIKAKTGSVHQALLDLSRQTWACAHRHETADYVVEYDSDAAVEAIGNIVDGIFSHFCWGCGCVRGNS